MAFHPWPNENDMRLTAICVSILTVDELAPGAICAAPCGSKCPAHLQSPYSFL